MLLHQPLLVAAFLVGCWTVTAVEATRILAAFHMNTRSHWQMFSPFLQALAARGHQVDVLGHFPLDTPMGNYSDLSVLGSIPSMLDNIDENTLRETLLDILPAMWGYSLEICEKVLQHDEVKKLLQSDQKYDLILTEIFSVDCFLPLAHKFNAPVVSFVTSVALPWSNSRMGNPQNPSYIPTFSSSFDGRMSFGQRLANTVEFIRASWISSHFNDPVDSLLRKHFGEDTPSVQEISKRTSLVLVNSHFSLNLPRPLVPAVVEVGGMHIQEPEKLPKELDEFLNGASHGVVYFSLGSMVRLDALTEAKIQMFVRAFAQLPERVLWKVGRAVIPGLPSNIFTMKWAPQLGVMSHPNVRVFITHGGLMGMQEAVFTGMPMVGMPLFADQRVNVAHAVAKGIAVHLDFATLSTDNIVRALRTVLDDPSYRENTQLLSHQFRDRPQTALDTAVFWTEYVIRHGGAAHLRCAATDMPWYQYLLIDVILTVVAGIGTTLALLWVAFSKLKSSISFGKRASDLSSNPLKKKKTQ